MNIYFEKDLGPLQGFFGVDLYGTRGGGGLIIDGTRSQLISYSASRVEGRASEGASRQSSFSFASGTSHSTNRRGVVFSQTSSSTVSSTSSYSLSQSAQGWTFSASAVEGDLFTFTQSSRVERSGFQSRTYEFKEDWVLTETSTSVMGGSPVTHSGWGLSETTRSTAVTFSVPTVQGTESTSTTTTSSCSINTKYVGFTSNLSFRAWGLSKSRLVSVWSYSGSSSYNEEYSHREMSVGNSNGSGQFIAGGTYMTGLSEYTTSGVTSESSEWTSTAPLIARPIYWTVPFVIASVTAYILLDDSEIFWYVAENSGDLSNPISNDQTSFSFTYTISDATPMGRTTLGNKLILRRPKTLNLSIRSITRTNSYYTTQESYYGVQSRVSQVYPDVGTIEYESTLNSSFTGTAQQSTSRTGVQIVGTISSSLQEGSTTSLFLSISTRFYTGADVTIDSYMGVPNGGEGEGATFSRTTVIYSIESFSWEAWSEPQYRNAYSHGVENYDVLLGPKNNIKAFLSFNTGYVAPDSGFYTKAPEFDAWVTHSDGNEALVLGNRLLLGVELPKLEKTDDGTVSYIHTWYGSGTGSAQSTSYFTQTNWCILPKGGCDFSSAYKNVNGLFADPFETKEYAVANFAGIFPFKNTVVLCNRAADYTLTSSIFGSNLTSGYYLMNPVVAKESVVDLEVHISKDAFFTPNNKDFCKILYDAVGYSELQAQKASEGVSWMQGYDYAALSGSSTTSTTSTTEDYGGGSY